MLFKIGKFGFLNNYLPYYWLEKQKKCSGLEGFEIVESPPNKLCEMIEKGVIDFAPIPSFFYITKKKVLRNYDFCIASKNRVLSVVVVSNGKELEDGAIAVSGATVTSLNLLKIILKERGLKNKLVVKKEKNANELLKSFKNALVIGDEAIKARMVYRVVMDLGEEWYEMTGYPMVFGISASLKEKNMEEVNKMIMNSVDWGINNLDEVVEEAKQKFSMPSEFLEEYFKTLSYRLGSRRKRGLQKFEEMCLEYRLLRK